MKLSVTVRVNQQAVVCIVRSSQRLIDDVVVVPAGPCSDRLVTDWAGTVLLTPKVRHRPFSPQVLFHPNAKAFFQIDFPGWVVWIAVALDFGVPF
jgi:hypothetical protein